MVDGDASILCGARQRFVTGIVKVASIAALYALTMMRVRLVGEWQLGEA